jgi:Domain of unknown function (DUF4266)
MKSISYLLSITLALTIVTLSACSTVKPWRKGNLAKAHMQFDPDPLEARFKRHIYESKEATSGGFGAVGGGCGCK